MRIREDGKHAHRTETIEQATEFWGCNKTTALMKSAEFSCRIYERIEEVLEREDLSIQQKKEISETLSNAPHLDIDVSCEIEFES
ncbi:DUF7692 domain-containing protein [Halorientalis halophila]|uniref:DUF7692 domain-containing protein n=1 Tax=Halorientalis halophila TaxID=3108499 RepID=UPI0030097FB1